MSTDNNGQFETPPPSDLFANMELDPAVLASAPAPLVSPEVVGGGAVEAAPGVPKHKNQRRLPLASKVFFDRVNFDSVLDVFSPGYLPFLSFPS